MANYCPKAGFKEVVELHKGQYYKLGNNFEVTCEYFDEGDSWICYKAGGVTVLNTNDCGIRTQAEAGYISNKFSAIDILLTQFSCAYRVSNTEDVAFRQQVADDKLKWMKFQCDVFKPAVTIPIASYIYFCHEENYYMSDSVNTAEKTFNFLQTNTQTLPVILYNGDEYHYPEKWDSQKSIRQYKDDFSKIDLNREVLVKNNPVPIEEIYSQSKIFIHNLNGTNNFIVKTVLRDIKIHLHDCDETFIFFLHTF